VDVVCHQAVAQYFKPAPDSLVLQHLQVGNAVRVSQEYVLPIVATLGDVMGQAGDDDAGDSGHDTG